jgi:hypothetical protein
LSFSGKENNMSYRNVLTVSAILSFLFGLGFMLMPGQLVTYYGVELDEAGRFTGQLYGATLFGFGLLNWFARDFADGSVQRPVLTANLLTAALGTIFSLLGQLGGVPGVNALGWSTVLLYLLLALGFGYLRFMRQ